MHPDGDNNDLLMTSARNAPASIVPTNNTYGMTLGNCTNIGGYGVRQPKRCLLFGDSITAIGSSLYGAAGSAQPPARWPNNTASYNQEGWWNWANHLLNGQLFLDPTLNKGKSGDTTVNMLARFQADVLNNLANFDIAFILGGANDITSGVATSTITASATH